MKNAWILFLLLTPMSSLWGFQSSACGDVPKLSDDQIREIIANERAKYKDIPGPYPQYSTTIRRDGCYYTYIEKPIPPRPEVIHIFKINKHGAIVDISDARRSDKPLSFCAKEKELSKKELAKIVKKERRKNPDLPQPFPHVMVSRVRCLYYYFEFELPGARGSNNCFLIDQFGGLMKAFVN